MQYRYAFAFVLILGLLSATLVSTRPVAADAYSGLSSPDAGAANGAPRVGANSPERYLGPSSVANAPRTPTPTTRPATWPGQTPQYPNTGYQPAPWMGALGANRATGGAPIVPPGQNGPSGHAPKPPFVPVEAKVCEDARIIARVGTEVIQAGDVMAVFVSEKLEDLNEPVPEEYREKLMMSFLPRAIVTKLMYLEAKRSIPEENLPHVKKEVSNYFYKKSIPDMMKRANVKTVDELGQKLVDLGSSLQWQQRLFIERALGQQWMSMEVKFDAPVNPENMLAYYQQHLTDYEHSARARWEELMVNFSRYPNKEAAYRKIADLGNQVMRGLPFAEAARRGSDGTTASDGGARDWTVQGSLVSERVDEALFRLPVGQLSPILESEQGLHIVRVVEREDAYRTPYTDVQEKIRKTLQDERADEESRKYLARLKDNTPIWTVYDEALAKKNGQGADAEPQRR